MLELSNENHYLLACSGGPDSMALFHMLLKDKIHFEVAFVNYHKRKESIIEEESVRNYCNEHNIVFHLLDTTGLICEGNFQSWARLIRYDFFADIINKRNLDEVLVAHQKDDLIETYIFQKNRKGIYSCYGINKVSNYKNIIIRRPLLKYRKKELEIYCINNNVPYFIDSSNLKDDYSRNVIRHTIVEKMDEKEIDAIIEEINNVNQYEENINKISNEYIKKSNKYIIDEFKLFPMDIQERIVFCLVNKYKNKLSKRETNSIVDFITSSNPSGIKTINNEVSLIKNYGVFYLSLNKQKYNYYIENPMIIENDIFFFDLINGEKTFFIKEGAYPLTISVAKKDEKVKIGKIEKKVNRLFIDEKIDIDLRTVWPCIKDCNGKIIYFPRRKEEKVNNSIVFKIKL